MLHSRRTALALLSACVSSTFVPGCGDSGVSDDESARLAYAGLDPSIDKVLDLGFKGYNEASSANIPPESTSGSVSGTLDVGGMVDAGVSNNKQMSLNVTYTNYSDGAVAAENKDVPDIVYTSNGTGVVDLSLKGLPNADLTGTMTATLAMAGGLTGTVRLNLSITGQTEDDGTGKIRRKAGTVHVTGTATSDYGVFDVDVSR
jgi:hypothetical protein